MQSSAGDHCDRPVLGSLQREIRLAVHRPISGMPQGIEQGLGGGVHERGFTGKVGGLEVAAGKLVDHGPHDSEHLANMHSGIAQPRMKFSAAP